MEDFHQNIRDGENTEIQIRENPILDIAECFNDYFANITNTLNIKGWPTTASLEPNQSITIKAINKYSNHFSILKINEKFIKPNQSFAFQKIGKEELQCEI